MEFANVYALASYAKSIRSKPIAPTENNFPFQYNYIEDKYDGFRMTLCYKDRATNPIALGRHDSINYWNKVAKIFRPIINLGKIPNDTIIDGEIYVPGFTSSDVASFLANGTGNLRFKSFAIITGLFGSLPIQRVKLSEYGFDIVESQARIGSTIRTMEDVNLLREEIVKHKVSNPDCEGFVLKSSANFNWMKIKPFKSLDVVITDVKEGTGKYVGLCGVFIVSYWNGKELKEVGSCKILDDQHRLPMDQAKSYIGEIIEVKYEGLTTHRRLKFTQFVRFRTDKPIQECVINE